MGFSVRGPCFSQNSDIVFSLTLYMSTTLGGTGRLYRMCHSSTSQGNFSHLDADGAAPDATGKFIRAPALYPESLKPKLLDFMGAYNVYIFILPGQLRGLQVYS